MSIQCHHLDKWEYMNLDMVEEALETHDHCSVLIGGATSSGKSYCAKKLKEMLEEYGHPATIISTDSYNRGVTSIITNKVEKTAFGGNLPFKATLLKIALPIVRDTPFEAKFGPECCEKIQKAAMDIVPSNVLSTYLAACQEEIKKLNFDEPDVYDLATVANDLKKLFKGETIDKRKYSKVISESVKSDQKIDGKKFQVFIVEGLYVLSPHLIKPLNRAMVVTDFIEGSPKSLFLRRIIRDAKSTSSPTYFTIQMYFSNIIKSYNETILPSSKNADIIFKNDMTFTELREGNLYRTKEKIKVINPTFIAELMNRGTVESISLQRDTYLRGKNEPSDFNNLLRMREVSTDEGQTFVPTSLVHKGAPKTRRDGKEIRPINILLKEGEFTKAFASSKDFMKKVTEAGFTIDRVVTKVKRKILLNGYHLTLSSFEKEGIWLEFSDPDIPKRVVDDTRKRASILPRAEKA